jgi:hypothetical protein
VQGRDVIVPGILNKIYAYGLARVLPAVALGGFNKLAVSTPPNWLPFLKPSKSMCLIIYGKIGPDEFCTFPYFDVVKSKYNKNNIVFLFGGDEIFNLKITDCHSYHKNMFGVSIYYKPYSDYLNYYKQFGKCFVRELEK